MNFGLCRNCSLYYNLREFFHSCHPTVVKYVADSLVLKAVYTSGRDVEIMRAMRPFLVSLGSV